VAIATIKQQNNNVKRIKRGCNNDTLVRYILLQPLRASLLLVFALFGCLTQLLLGRLLVGGIASATVRVLDLYLPVAGLLPVILPANLRL
jgi:hypothetical protein